ncbi:MAG: VWA domain-containing protein [bacterium]|nr:VWA domain-containing protein [bacterium]
MDDALSKSVYDWFSLDWFGWSRLQSFDWENPFFLYFLPLPLIILLLRWLFTLKSQKLSIALSKKDIKNDPISYFRFVPPLYILISLMLVIVALARPQKTNEMTEQWTEGIDIMLSIDISESMRLEDFRPNRLEKVKEVAMNFVNGRFQDRIGLVVFSGDAFSRSPLTTDYDLLRTYIEDITFELIQNPGTAIGSALAVATNRMKDSDSKSKVMILLSDGESNAGNLDPITAAELANAYGIKIYTIAIGKEGRVPYGVDFFGKTKYVENNLDETTLREIATIGGGKFYRASNNQALTQVFEEIDTLEKAEIKESKYKDTTDYYYPYLMWAIVFFLIWMLHKSTFMVNILAD